MMSFRQFAFVNSTFWAKSVFWKNERKFIIKHMLNYDSQYSADIP